MNELRAHAADRYLTWQDAGRGASARKQPPRKLGASPLLAAFGALALGAALSVAPPQPTSASTLTVGPKARQSLSASQQTALASFAGAPALVQAKGVRVGPAFGEDDEDCIRADDALICRR